MTDGGQRLITSQTDLPDIFVIKYAGGLSADALYAYLWINTFYRGKNFDLKALYDTAILSKANTDKALAELVAADLLVRSGNSFHMTDLIHREIDEYIRYEKALSSSGGGVPDDMSERNMLAESIQDTFFQGKMAYTFYSLIDKCLFEYKFEQTVVYNLFQEGLEQGKVRNIGEMRNLARRWYDKGYVTAAAFAEYKKTSKEIKHTQEVLGKLMRKRLDGLDIERIEKWIIDLNCSSELIEYAYRCNEYRNVIRLSHVEDTLVKWTSSGITTVDEAAKFEEEKHSENKRKSDRRKGRHSGAVTGAEAGIELTAPESTTPEEDRPAFGSAGEEGDSSEIDDILDIFGGSDE